MKISFHNFIVFILVVFGMVLTWQLLIGNHRANIKRDEAQMEQLTRNCKLVQEAKYSWEKGWQCKE